MGIGSHTIKIFVAFDIAVSLSFLIDMKHAALALAIIALFTALTSYAEEKSSATAKSANSAQAQQTTKEADKEHNKGVDMTSPDDEATSETDMTDDDLGDEGTEEDFGEDDSLPEEEQLDMPEGA